MLGDFERRDLLLEAAFARGAKRAPVAFDGVGVLLFAGDPEFSGKGFGGQAHDLPADRVGQPFPDRVDERRVAQPPAEAHLAADVGHRRHRFDAADDLHVRDVVLGGADDGLHSAGAVALDGVGGDRVRQPRSKRRHARDVGRVAGLAAAAEDDFVDARGVDLRTIEQRADRVLGQAGGRHVLERAAERADRRSHSVDDRESPHGGAILASTAASSSLSPEHDAADVPGGRAGRKACS